MRFRRWKRTLRRTTVQTWPFAEGHGQTLYAWGPKWTLKIVFCRKAET